MVWEKERRVWGEKVKNTGSDQQRRQKIKKEKKESEGC